MRFWSRSGPAFFSKETRLLRQLSPSCPWARPAELLNARCAFRALARSVCPQHFTSQVCQVSGTLHPSQSLCKPCPAAKGSWTCLLLTTQYFLLLTWLLFQSDTIERVNSNQLLKPLRIQSPMITVLSVLSII